MEKSHDAWEVLLAWCKHALREMESQAECQKEIKTELTLVRIEIAKLKVKAGIWGVVGGAVPVAIALAIMYMEK